ncbi:MAG TPA: glycosyl hydrolase family 18 protein [Symbiobacteriaceae bacterium]|nr:glycosyl hydrolase family 18 protein [Symbiobacteriaceae bacterium]
MRILPPAGRILSQGERKLTVRCRLLFAAAALALVTAACGRPAPIHPGGQSQPPPLAQPEAVAPAEPEPEPAPSSAPKPVFRAGIWLDSRWAEPGVTDEAVDELVRDLAARGITDLYVRAGSFRADGTLVLPEVTRVTALRRESERRGLRLWAWVPGLRHRMDFSARKTVDTAASSVVKLAAAGFDGVQLDLEPTPDDDAGYLALLEAVRGALPKGKLLGVATHLVRPHPPRAEWSADYFAEVARRVSQVAVMAYDTYAAAPEEFRSIVAYQTEIALDRSPAGTEVIIGVPTYEDRTERHTPETEPTWAGFAGVADGFRQADLSGRVTGWAIYAHFTTSEAEWRLFADRPR